MIKEDFLKYDNVIEKYKKDLKQDLLDSLINPQFNTYNELMNLLNNFQNIDYIINIDSDIDKIDKDTIRRKLNSMNMNIEELYNVISIFNYIVYDKDLCSYIIYDYIDNIVDRDSRYNIDITNWIDKNYIYTIDDINISKILKSYFFNIDINLKIIDRIYESNIDISNDNIDISTLRNIFIKQRSQIQTNLINIDKYIEYLKKYPEKFQSDFIFNIFRKDIEVIFSRSLNIDTKLDNKLIEFIKFDNIYNIENIYRFIYDNIYNNKRKIPIKFHSEIDDLVKDRFQYHIHRKNINEIDRLKYIDLYIKLVKLKDNILKNSYNDKEKFELIKSTKSGKLEDIDSYKKLIMVDYRIVKNSIIEKMREDNGIER